MTGSLRRPWLAAAFAVVAVIGATWLVSREPASPTPTGAPSTTSATQSDTLRLPAETLDKLQAIVDSFNAVNADSPPTSTEVVATSNTAADDALHPGMQYDSGEPTKDIYLIIETGKFTFRGASVPLGAELPTGSTVHLMVDATAMYVSKWGQATVDPHTLGPVATLQSTAAYSGE